MGRLNLVNIEDLEPGTVIRIHGHEATVTRVERSTDRHHWRLWLDGLPTYAVYPPTARFTFIPQPQEAPAC